MIEDAMRVFTWGKGKDRDEIPKKNSAILRFIAFDVVNPDCQQSEYEERSSKQLARVPVDHSFIVIPPAISCKNDRRITKIMFLIFFIFTYF